MTNKLRYTEQTRSQPLPFSLSPIGTSPPSRQLRLTRFSVSGTMGSGPLPPTSSMPPLSEVCSTLFAARCVPRSCMFPWAASQHVRRFDHVSTGACSAVCCVLHLGGGPDAHRWPLSQPRHVPSAIAVDSRLIPQDVSPVPLASLIVVIEGVSVAIGASPSSDLNLLYSGNLWDYLGETQKTT